MAALAEPAGRTWLLPERIIELSNADAWNQAVQEWQLSSIEMLDPGEFDKCLCGHYPIRQLCHIANQANGETATVGNRCVEKFDKDDPAHAIFCDAPRIFQAASRMLDDPTASANPSLIEFAKTKQIFTGENASFYESIWRKRKLSPKQVKYKISLNQKLLYSMILSTRNAYERLKSSPSEGTAGPKLIKAAFDEGVITEKNRDFYLKIWNSANGDLTEKQKKYKIALNKKIIQKMVFQNQDEEEKKEANQLE